MNKNPNKEPLIRISRKSDLKGWVKALIKVGAIVFAILLCGIISTIVKPGSFGAFFENVFVKNFASTRRGVTTFSLTKVITLLWTTSILFLIALAVTPAFKMKFWNLGGEGQVLMGGFGALIIMKFLGPKIGNNGGTIMLMLLVSVIFGAVWALIPAIFKCLFNTNETLFTLMLNYIAMAIVGFFSYEWRQQGGTVIGVVNSDTRIGWFDQVKLWDGNRYDYVIAIGVIILIGIIIWSYLRFSKHGYELSVVGGSRNTAIYVGIDLKFVVLRTVALSGAIAGICGWLLVSAGAHTVTENLVNGRGFTGVLLAWLGHFNPLEMAGYSFLVAFVTKGGDNAASVVGYSSFLTSVFVGVFFFIIIASEFFVNFNVHINKKLLRRFFKKESKDEIKEAK